MLTEHCTVPRAAFPAGRPACGTGLSARLFRRADRLAARSCSRSFSDERPRSRRRNAQKTAPQAMPAERPCGHRFSDDVQRQRQNNEHGADPLGGPGQLGIGGLCLVAGQERVGHAADGAGQALLPDWNSTTRIRARPHRSCKIVTKSCIFRFLQTIIPAGAPRETYSQT